MTTTSGGKTHFSPIGPLHLTAEECNEILMKRAMAASAQNHAITSADGQHAGSYSMMLRSLKQRYEWFVFGYELSACNYFNYSFTVFKPIQSPAHSS